MEDKSLFFITLSVICIWLVVDSALGENYIKKFLSTIFPFMSDNTSNDNPIEEKISSFDEKQKEKQESGVLIDVGGMLEEKIFGQKF